MNGRQQRALKHYSYALATGASLATLGWLMYRMPEHTPGQHYWPWVIISGVIVWLGTFAVWQHGRSGSAGLLGRWSRRSRRNQGVASYWSIFRHASAWAMLQQARVLRPGFGMFDPVRAIEVASPLARVGFLRVWSSCEDVTLRVGGPRTGKSGELMCKILDAPGAVIATSTRTDLYSLCAPVRERMGSHVLVFNPSGVGGMPSSVAFNPLSGCDLPKTAIHRAADLLRGASSSDDSGDRGFWNDQAGRVLAALLHAAALGGCSMRDVQEWLSDPGTHAAEIQRLLLKSPASAFVADAAQFLATNERTRSSITTTVMPALGWMKDEIAYASTLPTEDRSRIELDVEWLLDMCATVFLIGAEEAQTAPLVTALTAHIAREARRLAALKPSGRLDPPLTLVLDEAALICPVPLDRWTADMGGFNITMHIGAQSYAQLRDRFGQHAADSILGNTASLLVFGGTRAPDDLALYSTLSGEREVDVETFDADWRRVSSSTRIEPVLSPGRIAQLPKHHVMIIKRDLAPMIGKVTMAWNRPDVRAVQRAMRWEDRMERFEAWVAETSKQARIRWDDFVAWAKPRLAEFRKQMSDLWDRIARHSDELARRRRARRLVAAAQRRAQKRGRL